METKTKNTIIASAAAAILATGGVRSLYIN